MCCCCCLYFLGITINWYLHLSCWLFRISLRLLLSAWAWFCNWKISLSFLISMMSNSMENCLHLIWVLSGSLTFTSTWFCLYSSSGSFFLLFIHILCFYLNIFVRVWPQEIAKEACVWHICWPHDSSEIIYNLVVVYRRLNDYFWILLSLVNLFAKWLVWSSNNLFTNIFSSPPHLICPTRFISFPSS